VKGCLTDVVNLAFAMTDHPPPLDKDGKVQLTEAEIVQRLRTLQAPLRTGDFSKLCAERENRPPPPRPPTPSAV